MIIACIFACVGGAGLWLFLRHGIPNYLFFRVPFALLDYEKAGWRVFLENLLMLSFWAFIGTLAARICRNAVGKAGRKENPLLPVVAAMASVILGIALTIIFPDADGQTSFGNNGWPEPQAAGEQTDALSETQEAPQPDPSSAVPDSVSVDDGYVRITADPVL